MLGLILISMCAAPVWALAGLLTRGGWVPEALGCAILAGGLSAAWVFFREPELFYAGVLCLSFGASFAAADMDDGHWLRWCALAGFHLDLFMMLLLAKIEPRVRAPQQARDDTPAPALRRSWVAPI